VAEICSYLSRSNAHNFTNADHRNLKKTADLSLIFRKISLRINKNDNEHFEKQQISET